MRPEIKICGLTRPQDVEAAIRHGADMLGFIIECKSPRALSVATAAKLSRPAQGLAKRIAVTVNADDKLLDQICTHMRPDALQLHGDESPERVRIIKSITRLPIFKAISVRTKSDLKMVHIYAQCADYILLDAKPPKGSAQRGGHGVAFDWSLLDGLALPIPMILAGGLNPANIQTAIRSTDVKIFDVSSGIEASAGVKDHALLVQLMAQLMMGPAHE